MLSQRTRSFFAFVALLAAVHAFVVVRPLSALAADAPRAGDRPGPDLIARGQTLFEDQQYEESIQTLSAALLRPSNTKAQKIEVYRLLALNYITLNRKDEADSAVRGLLVIEPEYALPAAESPRFRDFFAQVKTKWDAEGRPGLVKDTEPEAPVTMRHNSPSQVEPGSSIELTARIDDPKHRVSQVKLFYRAGSHGRFEDLGAHLDKGGSVRATIPGSAVKPPLVEYYFLGFDQGGLPVVSRGEAGAPLRIAVPEPTKGWVLPVAIGGGILGAAAIVGGLALAGVFKSSPAGGRTNPPVGSPATVSVSVGE